MKKLLLFIFLSSFALGQYRILSPLYLTKSRIDTVTGRFVMSNLTTGRTWLWKNADGTVLLDIDTTVFRSFSDIKYWQKSVLDTTNLHFTKLAAKLAIADTATMLSNRFARDTVSLSNRINLKFNTADTTNLHFTKLASKFDKSDTAKLAYLAKVNDFTQRQTMPSLAADTIVGKSSTSIYLTDPTLYGLLKIRDSKQRSATPFDVYSGISFDLPNAADTVDFTFQPAATATAQTGHTTFRFVKYRRINGATRFLVWVNLDTANNIRFNAAKSSEFTYGNMFLDNGNFLVSAGYIGADSMRGVSGTTTRFTSGTWHGGLGQSSLGAMTATSLASQGAVSGTTGTFSGSIISTEYTTALPFVSRSPTSNTVWRWGIFSTDSTWRLVKDGLNYPIVVQPSTGIVSFTRTVRASSDGEGFLGSATATSMPVGISNYFHNFNNNTGLHFKRTSTGTGKFIVAVNSSDVSQFEVGGGGNLAVVGTVSTSGQFGSPAITDTVTYANVGATIPTKNLTSTAGTYRLSYDLFTLTAGSAGTAQMTLSFNNGAAQTFTSAAILLTTTSITSGGGANDVITYTVASGTPTVVVTVAGAVGSPKYTFHAIAERIK